MLFIRILFIYYIIIFTGVLNERMKTAFSLSLVSDHGKGSFKMAASFNNLQYVNSADNALMLVLLKALVYFKHHFCFFPLFPKH